MKVAVSNKLPRGEGEEKVDLVGGNYNELKVSAWRVWLALKVTYRNFFILERLLQEPSDHCLWTCQDNAVRRSGITGSVRY